MKKINMYAITTVLCAYGTIQSSSLRQDASTCQPNKVANHTAQATYDAEFGDYHVSYSKNNSATSTTSTNHFAHTKDSLQRYATKQPKQSPQEIDMSINNEHPEMQAAMQYAKTVTISQNSPTQNPLVIQEAEQRPTAPASAQQQSFFAKFFCCGSSNDIANR